MKLFEKIENRMACELLTDSKPWAQKRTSHKVDKTLKRRVERRRAKIDPECAPHYRKYRGWEY